MPSLDNLKKQAKLYLRWHRDQYYPVAAQIRALLPRCRNLSDAEILAQSFKLADAQELVARRHGFESWAGLKAGLATMTAKTDATSSPPLMLSAEPQLFVTDIKVSSEYFVTKLGFEIGFLCGEPPFYAQIRRDGARINLRHVDQPLIDNTLREREDLLSASINVDDVKQLYLEFQAAGAAFHQPLRKEPWGVRTFIVKDPDGNLLLFAGAEE
jgi:catechol 2,3-dioxygenase-like lactoylglutathione lyase family enzyme